MMVMVAKEEQEENITLQNYLLRQLESFYPIYGFSETLTDYDTEIESDLSQELLAENKREDQRLEQEKEGEEEKEQEKEKGKEKKEETKEQKKEQEKKSKKKKQEKEKKTEEPKETAAQPGEKAVEISREKLKDFDYLVQNFYQVDRTTTIDGSQLNAQKFLEKSMKLEGGKEDVQILIYHTHSQEGYIDSTPGDINTGVVGVAEYLTKLLQEKYGFNVMHHTGTYDVKDRDNAYSYAGPALEQILAEHPSIEVVIDLHRDGVADTTHLVSEVNGKQTAQIMFFNGLSRTTKNGEISYLKNPYLEDNLAFSFQMKLAAEEYYPGFARSNYLKGYRYNLHYRPKSLLVEVGAQTNTLEEAMNAMEPLADILHKVLAPQ
ncbi:MAG: stage II sporulation protein P [Lachnospiraceae bacterium]|nr:stage II sporulation protein P [Lachnospiraceae bacterium]